MAGIPDGLGAYDNGDGTFTVLANHEISGSLGVVRAHGGTGAFVSKWVVNKETLAVTQGEDLIKRVYQWDGAQWAQISSGSPLLNISRLCFGWPACGFGVLRRGQRARHPRTDLHER